MSFKYSINGFSIAILLILLCLLIGCEKKQKETPKAVAVSLDGSMEIGLMTFNLRYENNQETGKRAWRNRVVGIVGMLHRENVEILAIQEGLHGQVADLWASMPNFDFEGVGRNDGKKSGEYTGVFYNKVRFQADSKNCGTIWLSDTPYKAGSKTWGNTFPRMATWVRLLDRSSGQALWVVNTHFDHMNQESRDKGVRLIVSKLEKMNPDNEPVVVMGDFNATESNTAVRYLSTSQPSLGFDGLKETFNVLNASEKKRGTLHFWMNDVNRQWKVDHIFVSKQAKVMESKIVKSGEPYLSDHFPVKARVKFAKGE
jgi:endonuclease/exonuclease/phosphatase family metal-dependent hydrolase